jgi:hypothetical protein
MQAFDLSDDLARSGPTTEIEAKQLVGSFRRHPSHPQTDEETGDQRHVDLQVHPILTVTEEMGRVPLADG